MLSVIDPTPTIKIPKDIQISNGGINPDGTVKLRADGNIDWPDNDGFIGTPNTITLKPGTRIDRFGDNYGTYVSPEGIPYKNRALAPGTDKTPYTAYDVVQPTDNILSGPIASHFNEPGGGLQFKLPNNIEGLLKEGKIKIRNYFEIVGKGFTQTSTRYFTENLAEKENDYDII